MSEIDKILQMLSEHYGHNDDGQEVIRDLVSKRKKFASGGNPLLDNQNIQPIDGGYGDIVVTGNRYSPFDFLDFYNSFGGNNLNYDPFNDPRLSWDTNPTEDIVVTAPKNTSPPLDDSFSFTFSQNVTVDGPTLPPEVGSGDDEIVVTAPTTTPPPETTFSPSFSVSSVTLPPFTEPEPSEGEIVVTAPTTTPPPETTFSPSFSVSSVTLPPFTEPEPSVSDDEIVVTAPKTSRPPEPTYTLWTTPTLSEFTLPPTSDTPPPTTYPPETSPRPTLTPSLEPTLPPGTTVPPTTVTVAPTPALTWNPNMFPTTGPYQFPAEYKPLQQFNLPNYANVYDILFQGQGAGSDLGQSMLVPPDQQVGRLDNAMAVAQQAQQAQQPAPQQQAQQQNTGAGKARGGSVNDTIDGIIAYLQSIRR